MFPRGVFFGGEIKRKTGLRNFNFNGGVDTFLVPTTPPHTYLLKYIKLIGQFKKKIINIVLEMMF